MSNQTAWKITLTFLSLYAALAWLAAIKSTPLLAKSEAKIIACDVGQGDAILITQGQAQILIDGGPNADVISCLSRHLPFWDRTLELVVLTHPESDHLTGLIEVFRRYQVDTFLSSSLKNSTEAYRVLESVIETEGSQVLIAEDTNHLRLGSIYLDVLWPTQSFVFASEAKQSVNLNNYSVVLKLAVGEYKALFTGDILPEVSPQIPGLSDIDLLKVPHHGSKNGLTQELLSTTSPEAAIISVGKNQWGHPHQEVLDMLHTAQTKVFRTDIVGDIVIPTN